MAVAQDSIKKKMHFEFIRYTVFRILNLLFALLMGTFYAYYCQATYRLQLVLKLFNALSKKLQDTCAIGIFTRNFGKYFFTISSPISNDGGGLPC